eukprot:360210-Chlamydomonas_euryale.AAC.14
MQSISYQKLLESHRHDWLRQHDDDRKSETQSQGYRERIREGNACVEGSKAEGIKQRAGCCHKGHAIAHGPEPPHTHPTPPTVM